MDNLFQEIPKLWQLLVNCMPEYVFWKDINLKYMGCNNNYANLLGFKYPKDIIGKTDEELFRLNKLNNANLFTKTDQKVIKEQKNITNIIEEYTTVTGENLWISINRILIKDKNEIIGIFGFFKDITKETYLNQKLEYSEEKYKDLIEFTNTGYVIMNTNLAILECNQNFASILGKNSLGSIINNSLKLWVHIDDIHKFETSFKKLIKDKIQINNLEINIVDAKDQLKPIHLVANIIENGENRILCLIRSMMEEKIDRDIKRIHSQKHKDALLQKIREIRSDLKKLV